MEISLVSVEFEVFGVVQGYLTFQYFCLSNYCCRFHNVKSSL